MRPGSLRRPVSSSVPWRRFPGPRRRVLLRTSVWLPEPDARRPRPIPRPSPDSVRATRPSPRSPRPATKANRCYSCHFADYSPLFVLLVTVLAATLNTMASACVPLRGFSSNYFPLSQLGNRPLAQLQFAQHLVAVFAQGRRREKRGASRAAPESSPAAGAAPMSVREDPGRLAFRTQGRISADRSLSRP